MEVNYLNSEGIDRREIKVINIIKDKLTDYRVHKYLYLYCNRIKSKFFQYLENVYFVT